MLIKRDLDSQKVFPGFRSLICFSYSEHLIRQFCYFTFRFEILISHLIASPPVPPTGPKAPFLSPAQKKHPVAPSGAQILPVLAEISTSGPRPNPARWGRLGAIVFGAKERRAHRVSNPRASSSSSPQFPAGKQCQGCCRSAFH